MYLDFSYFLESQNVSVIEKDCYDYITDVSRTYFSKYDSLQKKSILSDIDNKILKVLIDNLLKLNIESVPFFGYHRLANTIWFSDEIISSIIDLIIASKNFDSETTILLNSLTLFNKMLTDEEANSKINDEDMMKIRRVLNHVWLKKKKNNKEDNIDLLNKLKNNTNELDIIITINYKQVKFILYLYYMLFIIIRHIGFQFVLALKKKQFLLLILMG